MNKIFNTFCILLFFVLFLYIFVIYKGIEYGIDNKKFHNREIQNKKENEISVENGDSKITEDGRYLIFENGNSIKIFDKGTGKWVQP